MPEGLLLSLLLVIIYVAFISLGLPDALLGAAWPVMHRELRVPLPWAGIVSTIIAGGTIISSLLSDRLRRRFGTGGLTALSVGLTAVALGGFAVSHSFLLLCLWAVPYGLGAGSVDAALNGFVALHYQARHMNWLHCFWGVGASAGPVIMGACLIHGAGWNRGYLVIALMQAVLAALLFLSLPLWKRKDAAASAAAGPFLPLRELLRLPGAGGILMAFFGYCALETTAGLWGASYMAVRKGFPPELAARLCAFFYLGITAGRFLSGFLSMRLGDRGMIRLGQALIFTGLAVLPFASAPIAAGVGLLLIGLGCAPIYPALLHQTPGRFGTVMAPSVMGLQMAAAYVGSTFMPPLAGALIGRFGMGLWLPVLLIFLFLTLFFIERDNARS